MAFGGRCAHCKYDIDTRALQLDHLHGGGLQKKKLLGNTGIYRRALKNPGDYQLLCANCNIIKLYKDKEHLRRY